jgi:hypothetical protein
MRRFAAAGGVGRRAETGQASMGAPIHCSPSSRRLSWRTVDLRGHLPIKMAKYRPRSHRLAQVGVTGAN